MTEPCTLITSDVARSDLDPRLYRLIKLPNEMRVLLISCVKRANQSTNQTGASSMSDLSHCTSEEGEDSGESDEEEDEEEVPSAVAVGVNVGSYSSPENAEGLSHFLEHMLFMGSEKYPAENDFDSYLQLRGGSSNAYTQNERTVYFFKSNQRHFASCLDRFAQFFIGPLMLVDSVDRELNAVDNEFQMAKKEDSVICSHLMMMSANKNSPSRNFGYGNKESLKTIPEGLGIDVHGLLRQHWLDYYSADRMAIVVQSRDSLDDLQDLVMKSFHNVPLRKELKSVDFMANSPKPFDSDRFRSLLKVYGVQEDDRMYLNWAMPSLFHELQSLPSEFLGKLLGYEGRGSIDAYLKENNYAYEVDAGASLLDDTYSTSFYYVFPMSIKLTQKGFENWDIVVEACCAYVRRITEEIEAAVDNPSSPLHAYVEQVVRMSQSAFRFVDEEDSETTVTDLIEPLLILPEDQLCNINRVHTVYSKSDLRLYGSLAKEYMKPDNMQIILKSKQFKVDETWEKERWFETLYRHEPIDPEMMKRFKSPRMQQNFFLPSLNPFEPKSFDLLPKCYDRKHPRDLNASSSRSQAAEFGQLWHKQDTRFQSPKGCLRVILWNPAFAKSTKSAVMGSLWSLILSRHMPLLLYDAEDADMEYSLSYEETKYVIEIDGFSDVLPKLMLKMVDIMVAKPDVESGERSLTGRGDVKEEQLMRPALNEQKFDMFKTVLKKKYLNSIISPYDLIKSLVKGVYTDASNHVEKLACLEGITLDDLLAYQATMFSQLHICMVVVGNVTESTSKQMYDYIIDKTKAKGLRYRKIARMIKPPQMADAKVSSSNCSEEVPDSLPVHRIRLMNADRGSVNSFALMKMTVPGAYLKHLQDAILKNLPDLPTPLRKLRSNLKICNAFFYVQVMNELFSSITSEPAFDFLRTKMTLGYIVHLYDVTALCGTSDVCDVTQANALQAHERGYLGLSLSVSSQASEHSINECTGLMLAFWRRFVPNMIHALSDEKFDTAVESLIDQKREEILNLQQSAQRDWSEIYRGSNMFDNHECAIKLLENLAKTDLIEFVRLAYFTKHETTTSCAWNTPLMLITEIDALADPPKEVELQPNRDFKISLDYCLTTQESFNASLAEISRHEASANFSDMYEGDAAEEAHTAPSFTFTGWRSVEELSVSMRS